MAYHGYIPAMKSYLSSLSHPRVFEIGLDKGMTSIPLLCFMARYHKSFKFVGVDILFQDSLTVIANNLDYTSEQEVKFYKKNSLELLPDLVKSGDKFDLILVDGDHNYYTVAEELKYLNDITSDKGIVIVDDYEGRWANKDLWYSDREDYENVEIATKVVSTEKHGVKTAVDEFLALNSDWVKSAPIVGEPVVLNRRRL